MRFKSATIKEFKRFTDLTVSGHSGNSAPHHAGWTERIRQVVFLRCTPYVAQVDFAETSVVGKVITTSKLALLVMTPGKTMSK